MGKFAGYLKRLKNLNLKAINTGAKVLKTAKNIWNTVITKPGVGILNTLMPETKTLTDALFDIDNYVNKGIDWFIDKTNTTKNTSNGYKSLPNMNHTGVSRRNNNIPPRNATLNFTR